MATSSSPSSDEEDIYHTMLRKAFRNTSSSAIVAAKLAREKQSTGKS